MSSKATVDLIYHDPKRDAFILIVVEKGPWTDGDSIGHMRKLQERLNDHVDIALFGALAQKYPDSQGKPVVIRLDGYDTPEEVESFFHRFSETTLASSEVQSAIAEHGHVSNLLFEYHRDTLKKGA